MLIFFYMIISFSAFSQDIDDLYFGTDNTFEAMTWNIEWFPKNGTVTTDYVAQIIEALDVDLLAIQEIDDISAFEQMVENLDGYEGYLESAWFAGLAYIYKTDVIQINNIYEIYTTSPYWNPFPRSPMVMDLNFMDERIIVINNHFKCCGDGILDLDNPEDEETRRYLASNLLKEYIDNHFANLNTIVLGDLNDALTDEEENNVFQNILDDDENYLFADFDIATGDDSDWSYPTWPSHLDHILITNELFDDFENSESYIQTIKIDEYISGGWWGYENNVSDHRPVALKLLLEENSNYSEVDDSLDSFFKNYPNPFSTKTVFSFRSKSQNQEIRIFNLKGQNVFSEEIQNGKSSITWNSRGFANGIYFAKLLENKKIIATSKLILIK
ncbi:MAG: endonuclease/exonuclease/phosphatase family protein [Candidatus Cloacimonadota bacterium]|nr:endonuclease/exonuclease/phosphatase family protein [Candidatus Cloacimonadota bacterium]